MRVLLLGLTLLLFQGVSLAGDPAKGRAISEKGVAGAPPCATCHGVDGSKPVAPENPVLAGQYEDYIVRALMDYKSGKRANPVMKAIVDPMKRKDIEDVAAWFARQKSTLHFQR
jgi:cytochrome c553